MTGGEECLHIPAARCAETIRPFQDLDQGFLSPFTLDGTVSSRGFC